MASKILHLAIDARQARVGAVAFRKSTRSIMASATSAGTATKAMGASMAHTAGAIKNMILPLVGLVAILKTVTTIAKFEEAMATLGAVTGEVDMITRQTTASFEEMTKTARLLGSTTRFSASEASEGMLQLARAGFSARETMDAIPHTLDLATSAGIGLGEASGYVANTIRQFGLEASRAVDVADAFIVVSNKSNTTVGELAEAMKMVGTVSASVGASVEETASVIGILGDRGVKATMAGTQLRGVLIALAKPTDKAQRAMEQLGLSTADLDPAQNSLHDISVKLDGAFSKLGNRYDALGIASEIFGRRNASGALAMASSADKLRDLTLEAERSKEAHTDMANVMDDTVIGAWFGLKSAIEEAMLVMGDAGALGGMRAIIDTAGEMVRIFADVEGAWDMAGTSAKVLATAIEIIVTRFVIIKSLGMISWLIGFNGAMFASVVASGGLASAIKGIGVAIASNPIGLILTGIAIGYVAITSAIENGNDALEKRLKLEEALTDSSKLLFTNLAELQRLEKEGNLVSTRGQNLMRERAELLQDEEIAIRAKIDALELEADAEEKLALYKDQLASGYTYNYAEIGILEEKLATYYDLYSQMGDNIQQQEKLEQSMIALGLGGSDLHVILGKLAMAHKAYIKELTAGETSMLDTTLAIANEIAILEIRGKTIEETIALQEIMREGQKEGIEYTAEETATIMQAKLALDDANKSLDEYLKVQEGIANPEVLNNMELMIQKLVNMGMGLDEATDKATQLKLSGEAMNDSFANAFGDMITGASTAKEALKSFFQFILDEILKLQVLNPMKDLMGGIFGDMANWFGGGGGAPDDYNFMSDQSGGWMPNAHGNAYGGNGKITAFASGGVVSAPTLFNYAGGTGLMGEAGAEAIMPLKRDSKGNLGVASEGGQSKVVNVSMTVIAKDVDSFRRSQSQVLNDIQKAGNRLN